MGGMSGRVVLFTVLRLAVFAVPLTVLLWIGFDWWWAALLAAIVGVCVSIIALAPLRDSISRDIANRVDNPEPDADAEFEDASAE